MSGASREEAQDAYEQATQYMHTLAKQDPFLAALMTEDEEQIDLAHEDLMRSVGEELQGIVAGIECIDTPEQIRMDLDIFHSKADTMDPCERKKQLHALEQRAENLMQRHHT